MTPVSYTHLDVYKRQDLADVPRYVLKFFVDNHLNLRALDDMLNVWITPVPCSCEVFGDAE